MQSCTRNKETVYFTFDAFVWISEVFSSRYVNFSISHDLLRSEHLRSVIQEYTAGCVTQLKLICAKLQELEESKTHK